MRDCVSAAIAARKFWSDPATLESDRSRFSFLLDAPMPSLDQLVAGQRARIEAVCGEDALVQRLLEMGLLEGEEIEVVGFAPLGDPMEIRLRD